MRRRNSLMKKRLTIIPGGWHKPTDKCYQWMIRYFKDQGFEVRVITIEWKRHTMSDLVEQFQQQFQKEKAVKEYLLGFSFGAMIASIAAAELKPDRLFLCSLSPYFSADVKSIQKADARFLGYRRLEDFKKYNARPIAKAIKSPTVVFCGEREGKRYPALLKRCKETAAQLTHAKLVMVPDAPHEIDFPTYVELIKNHVS